MSSKSLAFVITSSLLVACSSGSSTPSPGGDAGHPDAANTKPDAGRDGGHDATEPVHDAGRDVNLSNPLKDASPPDAARDASSDAEDDADGSIDAGVDVTDEPFDASPYVPIDGGHAPMTGLAPEAWTWVPFPESRCRDGSTTGLGVNPNPSSKNLLIFLEGGGACFNLASCATNPSSFGAADFPGRFPSASDGGAPELGQGILDRTTGNPVADWNFVYVPYCTGDIHAGNNPAGNVPGANLPPQVFMGYQNVELFLQRILPTFPDMKQVLLTGVSGGGFGAAANYLHVQRAFGSVPVNMIDDSGPFMEDPYLPRCLQDLTRSVWGLDSTLGADCDGHCNDPGTFFLDLAGYALSANPHRVVGLMDSTDDQVITSFFGFGMNDCDPNDIIPTPETEATFSAGLDDIRTKLGSNKNLATFYFTGTDHTSLEGDTYFSRDTSTPDGGSEVLTDWVASIIAGSAPNDGP